jgi:hypothetical protein
MAVRPIWAANSLEGGTEPGMVGLCDAPDRCS